MGDQTPFATLQQLVDRAFDAHGKPRAVPVGSLHSELATGTNSHAESPVLPGIGFAEVYWADICRDYEEYVLEESTSWADTIVGRLELLEREAKQSNLTEADYVVVRRILTDMVTATRLVRALNRGFKASGMGSIDLENLLVRYLGDVQLFAEFRAQRAEILDRFIGAMFRIHRKAPGADIHICAHSQGSVVAFMGLLEGRKYDHHWVDSVRTFVTIGSPIDKFLLLWPELFARYTNLAPKTKNGEEETKSGDQRIRWHNYADRGDPVGGELKSARGFLKRYASGLFEDAAPRDSIFRRYLVPGKAHIDYWRDHELMSGWLDTVTKANPSNTPPPAPRNSHLARIVAPLLPFALSLALCLVAAHFFASAIDGALVAGGWPSPLGGLDAVLAVGLTMFGTIALSGASRYSRLPRWLAIGSLLFVAGVGATVWAFGYSTPVALVLATLFAVAAVRNVVDRIGRAR